MSSEKEEVNFSKRKLEYGTLNDPQIMGLMAAIFVIFIPLIIYFLYQKRKSLGQNVLLLGLCESGKTVVYAQLVHNTFADTQTSMKENIGEYKTKGTTLKILDIPGHERLRYKFFDEFKVTAKGIIYIIDSVSIQKDIKDVAEFLYNTLVDNVVQNSRVPVLILCNKQDEATAKGASVIKTLLEKELNVLRKTKTAQLQSVENTSSDSFLGIKGKDFEFVDLRPARIDFAESSAVCAEEDSDADLEAVHDWLNTL